MVGSAGLLLVRHNKVSVELLQEEKVVVGGWGENGCFPWEPASAGGTLISNGESHLTDQSQTALNETFGHILLCKMQCFLLFVESPLVVLCYSIISSWHG